MGFIYSRASEVLVALTSSTIPVLQQAIRSRPLSPSHLAILEAEDWVTRAWTYQEAVNAYRLRITCDDSPPSTAIDMMPFFSLIGSALLSLPPTQRKLYPRLSSLEDLLADCAVAKYLERSALQIMTIMDERTQTQPEDHFYAMMGAISTEPAKAVEGIGPCEAFMRLCERKGDYSFLFCKENREERMGKRWRPVECELRPVIKSHSKGGGLRGRVDGGRVVLDGVVVLELGKLGERAKGFIEEWLVAFERMKYGSWPNLETERAAYEALRVLGYSGSGEYLATECGLVFPQNPAPQSAQVKVIVAAGIRWTLGAPALIQFRDDVSSDEYMYEPGVFFGQVPDGGDVLRDVMLC
ncbi:Heterokaryon incompatibility domain-containing protein [Madurella fahalii]|uniref:Heterokaryon incompatibility domain-containing protein n=1 Tax=Madurella fahalii TaxID=1157608 RepID=A0ABQ0G2R0_9PEZI